MLTVFFFVAGLLSFIAAHVLTRTQNTPVEPVLPSTPTVPPTVPESDPPADLLETFCTAIRDYEGSAGDLNYRNNNPGNFRCSPVGYDPKYGKVECVGGFARFQTWDLGWTYLKNSVRIRAKIYSTWTILQFFEHYAPYSDNNRPDKYAAFVAKRCGLPVDTKLGGLFG